MSRRRRDRQAGMGLMFVLGLGLLIMGMGALAHMLVTTTLGSSSRHVRQEQALNLAEQGIDQTLARLNADAGFNTDAQFGPRPAGVVTVADEEAWVRGLMASAPAASVQRVPGGQLISVKPSNAHAIYSGSWVPSRARPLSVRVVRTVVQRIDTAVVSHAILTEGDIKISGNPAVSGSSADVHSNEDIDIGGSPTIGGDLTASGSFATNKGTVVGTRASGMPPVTVPSVEPREVWRRSATAADVTGSWYDLCPDGTVRRPTGSAPCLGSLLAVATSNRYRGWLLSGDNWDLSGNDGSFSGVYYAYRKGIKVSGNPGTVQSPWNVTLISEAASSGSVPCPTLGSGDIEVSGNPNPAAFLQGLLLVAGRDLKVNGNPGQVYVGLLTSREQFLVSGNPTLRGSLISQTDCDTAASPIHLNEITGNMGIENNGDLSVSADGGVRATFWSEL